ncbi:MAG: nucleotidyl transferase AbiEii/AbiGii toxin family protein [Treponema sp.]|jgi:predicted nucleotidyltransferase component of viral defense system|nr:nucleotidyl transferase AbiEii/AbiGii toxin family protein [Treponema sp.]
MLQKEALVQEMISLIKELQSNSLFKDHNLVGGTALTLQLGHRTSTDIDLFTTKTQNATELADYFNKNYKNINVQIATDNFTRVFVNNIKVEMVQYEEKILEEPKNEEGIRLLGINEIAAMKLNTIMHRSQPRDFIDLAYLLKELSLQKMFGLYEERHDSISPLYMKRTLLTKSRSIKDNEWLVGGIKMLRHDIEPKDVPIFIEQAIEEYNKNINVGK